MDANEEKPELPEPTETIAERLAFKSRFVMVFGEINHAVARRDPFERRVGVIGQYRKPRVLLEKLARLKKKRKK